MEDKQTHRPRQPIESSHVQATNFQQKKPKTYSGEKKVSSKLVLGKLEGHMQMNKTKLLFETVHKNELKMD